MYDTLYRSDVVWEAWKRVKKNKGAPGVDGQTLEYIEEVIGVVPFLVDLQQALHAQDSTPEAVLRQWIPKPGSPQKRPLGISVVRDRGAQTAAKLVLEPIFEANFLECSYGFRPGRNAHDAIDTIRRVVRTKSDSGSSTGLSETDYECSSSGNTMTRREAPEEPPMRYFNGWDWPSSAGHGASTTMVADTPTEKVVGEPYWGKPDVRFDEGAKGR